jgi:hypothetical protein
MNLGMTSNTRWKARSKTPRPAVSARRSYKVIGRQSGRGAKPARLGHKRLEDGKPIEYRQEPAASIWRRVKVDTLSMLPLDELL